MSRTNTPDRVNANGSKTITTKRACNGCSQLIGDITEHEITAAISGRPLPDVRRECPNCAPTAPEPSCIPMQVIAGDTYCVLRDCDHEVDNDDDYCDEVREETICATHSKFGAGADEEHEAVTISAPWPCTQAKAVA